VKAGLSLSNINIAVLASGNGSNLQAIIDHVEKGILPVNIKVVISNKADAFALKRAHNHSIEAIFVDAKQFLSRQDYERKLIELLEERNVELVVLAGYMLLVTEVFIDKYYGRLINLHPALLPSFPGVDGIGDALKYGCKVTGVTVHFVDKGCDTGPIIIQEPVKIKEGETREELAERIHKIEHELLPLAVRLYAEGKLKLEGRTVRVGNEK
jgi:phosphoribosylglycinamide formyltransferase-1